MGVGVRQQDVVCPERVPLDERENRQFWSRLGGKPELREAVVADIGPGRGTLCIDMARSGAKQVVGLDVELELVEFATQNLHRRHGELSGKVTFRLGSLRDYPDNYFDVIVAKDSFEHIEELHSVMKDVRRCLRVGGRLYAGFGPLYNSFAGHHGGLGTRLPWGHLWIPESVLVRRVNRDREQKVASLRELNVVNGKPFADYRTLLHNAGLRVVMFKVNQSRHIVSKVFSVLRKIPGLQEYFTHNIYCILEKTPDVPAAEGSS